MLRRLTILLLMVLSLNMALAPVSAAPHRKSAEASIIDVSGSTVGRVVFSHNETSLLLVEVEVSNLEPGFHAFHVHAVGECDASSDEPFSSAGDHLTRGGQADEIGQMPPLYAMANGRAWMTFETDTFDLGDVFDTDGAAVIIHAASDSLEVTSVSYPADEEVAGERVACAVFGVD